MYGGVLAVARQTPGRWERLWVDDASRRGSAGAVAPVAAHELGAGASAIRATRAAVPEGEAGTAAQLECQWQRDQVPAAIGDLVLDDQQLRNDTCWSVFEC